MKEYQDELNQGLQELGQIDRELRNIQANADRYQQVGQLALGCVYVDLWEAKALQLSVLGN